MIKKSQKQIITLLILTALLSFSIYTTIIPTSQATELTNTQKGLTILSDVISFDLTKYNIKTEEGNLPSQIMGDISREIVIYDLDAANSKIKAAYTFANGNLQGIQVFKNEGTPILNNPVAASDDVKNAQDFLNSYQTYSNRAIFGELKNTLNNIDTSKNFTKTVGDKVLQVTFYTDNTHFKWHYTANGAVSPYSKVISMTFKDGFLTSFIDNWDLYTVGNTNVNLTEEEAVTMAMDVAREHSWTAQLDEETLYPINFNKEHSVSWVKLSFDCSIYANEPRSEDYRELYPVWRVGLVLNKVYGELYGLEVDIWADTKEVRSVKEEYSQLAAEVYEKYTQKSDTNTFFINYTSVSLFLLSAVMVSVIVAALTKQFKQSKTLYQLKPHCLKMCIIFLSLLMILVIFLPLVESASASNAGIIWGSKSTGAPNSPESHSWRKTDPEILCQSNVTSYIGSNCFIPANGYSGFNSHGANKNVILYQGEYLRDNYDYVAVVDWNHGVGGYPGQTQDYPTVDEYEEHHMFEDDWGTLVGPRNAAYNDFSHGVYDIDIYNTFTPAKVHFAFIDACQSANLYRLGQGFTATGNPLGMPFAFTHRIVTAVPLGYTGTLMSADGYGSPDTFPQCYIGFPLGSAALDQNIPYEDENKWIEWIYSFFYIATNFDVSINNALDWASSQRWQCGYFSNSPLQGSGFKAVWPIWNGEGWMEDPVGSCTLGVYGNGNIHLKNFQPSHIVTAPYINGPSLGDTGIPHQFSTYAIDSNFHNIKYRINWDDGSPYTETGWYSNGATVNISHTWTSNGIYNIRAQAQCSNGLWSSWSDYHTIVIGDIPTLTVRAYSQSLGTELSGVPVYLNSQYQGTTPFTTYILQPGYYDVSTPPTLYWLNLQNYYYNGNYYYNSPINIPIYTDTTVNANYS